MSTHDKSDKDHAEACSAIEQALTEELVPIDPPLRSHRAIGERLLARVQSNLSIEAQFTTVRSTQGRWRRLLKGVQSKNLSSASDGRSVLVKLSAGFTVPAHHHFEDEECVVLAGTMRFRELQGTVGTFHLAPAGSKHSELRAETDALIYVRGTCLGSRWRTARDLAAAWVPSPELECDTVPIEIGWEEYLPGIRTKKLWQSGEKMSRFFLLEPGARLPAWARPTDEELMMVEGEVFIGDTLLRAGDYRFSAQNSPRMEIYSDIGAIMYLRGIVDNSGQQTAF